MARSTAEGRAAIAVVRLSGPDARRIAGGCLESAPPARERSLTHTRFVAGGHMVDEVVVASFRAPRSYTGEDVVEISCHGNPVLTLEIVDALVAAGARPAGPGEFTRRAFLNGKLDLAQAEAVCRLIAARSVAGARGALAQLAGGLSDRVSALRRAVLETLARIEAHVDFPEEDLSAVDGGALLERLRAHAASAARLHAGARRARATAGVTSVAILGVPNAGKSALFNALVGRDRAIVHDVPGTTRDVVDAEVTLGSLALRLTDTAGLRDAGGDAGVDAVEVEGMRRSREAAGAADRIVVLVDGTRAALTTTEQELLATCDRSRTLVVLSKSDRPRHLAPEALEEWEPIPVSAVTGEGLPTLEAALAARVRGDAASPHDTEDLAAAMAGSERVERVLGDASGAARRAVEVLEQTAALELVAEELRGAANALGAITGERAGPELLDVIFSEFCIGK